MKNKSKLDMLREEYKSADMMQILNDNPIVDMANKIIGEPKRVEPSTNMDEMQDGKLVDSWENGFNVPDALKNNVDHPSHYIAGLGIEHGIECIDAMLQIYGVEAVKQFCLLNAFKYLWRCNKKHDEPKEDIEKAQWYLAKYIELG